MRTSNFSRNHPYAKARGWVSPNRAANSLPNVSDGSGNEVINASEILVIGGTVSEPEDGIAQISFGGLSGSSNSAGVFPGSAGTPVYMKNNAAFDLIPGDVVVTDPTDDSSVTTTATASNTRIAGVVQAPIAVNTYGPVLFNGLTTIINTTGTITRGSYAMTSASARLASATATRGAGNFGVYLTGADLPDFASAAANTEAPVPVNELEITMPPTIPANRILFLALWLEDGVSSVSVDGGWTLVGAETDFYYYVKASVGDDTATASWTTSSTAVATVLVLHDSVSLANPIESHDYENTTSASSVSGLDSNPRYALAGVRANVAAPGSSFLRLGGGSAAFDASGTPSLVQSKYGNSGGNLTLDNAVATGNLLLAVPFMGNAADTYSTDVRQGGACPVDTNMAQIARSISTETNPGFDDGNNALGIMGKLFSDTYGGPFATRAACTANTAGMVLMEFENVGIADYAVASDTSSSVSGTIDLGTFAGTGANDVVVMAIIWKATDGSNGWNPNLTLNGFTTVFGNLALDGTSSFGWVGYKIGDGDASVTAVSHYGSQHWAAAAVKLTGGAQAVAGTLAGKYIGTASSVTSPFSGAGKELDGTFAINLMTAAKPSALLYGPDLGGGGGGSEPTADAHIGDTSDAHDASAVSLLDSASLFTATDVEAAIAELAAKDIGYTAHGNMGSTETLSALTGWHSGTFNADCTFTFSGATSGIVASMVLELLEDGTGGWDPTWPGSVVWPGGVTPTHTTTAGTTTIYLFQSRDGGTTWYGFQAGSGGSAVGALADLSDVTITTPAENDTLRYISGEWVNDNRRWEPVTNNPGAGPELVWDGDDLVYHWTEY